MSSSVRASPTFDARDKRAGVGDTFPHAASRHVSEQERLDRIERHLKLLAAASAALHEELLISRRLAAERARSARLHESVPRPRRNTKKKRDGKSR